MKLSTFKVQNSYVFFYFKRYQFCNFQQLNRESRIKIKLEDTFKPIHLDIENESYKHSVPKNSETHFKIVIVSDKFNNKSSIESHRLVYKVLSDEMGEKKDNKLHAISLFTFSTDKWKKSRENEESIKKIETPPCVSKKI